MKDWRRADDNTSPHSPAHQEMMDRVEACYDDLLVRVDSAFNRHVEELHHPAMTDMFPNTKPEDVVRSLVEMTEAVPYLLDVVVGPPKLDRISNERLVDGRGHVIRDESKGLRHHLSNGGVPAVFPWTKLILVLAGQIGLIVAALVTIH